MSLLLSLNSYKTQEDNNLVLNPSFESIDGKLKKLNQIDVSKDWYSPTSLKAVKAYSISTPLILIPIPKFGLWLIPC
ncbi:hypothetical protein N9K77_00380 [bacterium]|nr:hypothetical protein [bacterium]